MNLLTLSGPSGRELCLPLFTVIGKSKLTAFWDSAGTPELLVGGWGQTDKQPNSRYHHHQKQHHPTTTTNNTALKGRKPGLSYGIFVKGEFEDRHMLGKAA